MSFGGIQAGRAYVGLYTDDKGLVSGLRGARAKLAAWGKSLSLTGMLGGAAGALGVGLGFGGLVAGITASVNAARESVRQEMKLRAALAATGGAAGLSAEELMQHAANLQKVTNFDDEATIGSMALLASFKQIKGDEFKRTIELAQDLATLLETDLPSATRLFGRAMADPVRGMMLLRKAGVQLTAQQEQAIKGLAAAGRLREAQQMFLGIAQGGFGGMARAAADPFTQMKNAWGDVMERVGMAMMPLLASQAQLMSANLEGTALQTESLSIAFEKLADTISVMVLAIKTLFLLLKQGAGLFGAANLLSEGFDPNKRAGEWEQLFEEFKGKMPSERAAEWRLHQEDKLRKLRQRTAGLAEGLGLGLPSAATPPAAMVAGSAELAAAMARTGADAQLAELQRLNLNVEDIQDNVERLFDRSQDGEQEEVADIL